MKSRAEMWDVVKRCYYPGYLFTMQVDGRGALYLQAEYKEADVETDAIETQKTRRWFLSPEMTTSEIVQTVFKCLLTSMEHRSREFFQYKGKAVFGPHFDVEALVLLCEAGRLDKREKR